MSTSTRLPRVRRVGRPRRGLARRGLARCLRPGRVRRRRVARRARRVGFARGGKDSRRRVRRVRRRDRRRERRTSSRERARDARCHLRCRLRVSERSSGRTRARGPVATWRHRDAHPSSSIHSRVVSRASRCRGGRCRRIASSRARSRRRRHVRDARRRARRARMTRRIAAVGPPRERRRPRASLRETSITRSLSARSARGCARTARGRARGRRRRSRGRPRAASAAWRREIWTRARYARYSSMFPTRSTCTSC